MNIEHVLFPVDMKVIAGKNHKPFVPFLHPCKYYKVIRTIISTVEVYAYSHCNFLTTPQLNRKRKFIDALHRKEYNWKFQSQK